MPMDAPRPPSPEARALRLAVLALGLWGLGWIGREAIVGLPGDPLAELGASPLTRLGTSLSDSETERVARHLDANRPGASDLLATLKAELPADAALIGFHRTADQVTEPDEEAQRASALALLGQLQLLLHPIPVHPMPNLGPDWTPPAGIDLEHLWALDLGYPTPELLEALLEPARSSAAGTLWRPRSPEQQP